MTALWRR